MCTVLLLPAVNPTAVNKYISINIRICVPVSEVGIATGYGWTVRRSKPGGGEIFRTSTDRPPGTNPASCRMCTVSFPVVKSGLVVTLTPHSF